jgi:hypothetical protein
MMMEQTAQARVIMSDGPGCFDVEPSLHAPANPTLKGSLKGWHRRKEFPVASRTGDEIIFTERRNHHAEPAPESQQVNASRLTIPVHCGGLGLK